MSVAEEILDAAIQELKDEAVELIPVAISAIKGLLQGQPPERVNYAQKRLDQALERGKGG
jgi:hypothetical protein